MHYEASYFFKPFLFIIDVIGSLFFFWIKFYQMPSNPRKILVIRLDHAGDLLMTVPVLRALRARFPMAELSLLCRPFVKEIIDTNPAIDSIFVFEPPWFRRGKSAGWLKAFSFFWSLRKQKFDVVVELHADPRNILAAFLAGGFRLGYAVRGFGFLLNKTVKYSLEKKHMIERNLDVVRSIGADAASNLELFLKKKYIMSVKKELAEYGIKSFVLLYAIKENTVLLVKFEHHDNAYR